MFTAYFQELLEQGVFIPPSQFETCFVSTAHTEDDLKFTINAFDKALAAASKTRQTQMILTVGTRGSKLALAQTNRTLQQIKQKSPDVEFKLKVIKTIGDKEHGKPLFAIDCKGIFEKEIDQQVVSGEVDFAVHSLKDVPIVEQQTGTVLAAIPKRDSQCDVFISKDKVPLNALPKGAVVGTGSLRRLG